MYERASKDNSSGNDLVGFYSSALSFFDEPTRKPMITLGTFEARWYGGNI